MDYKALGFALLGTTGIAVIVAAVVLTVYTVVGPRKAYTNAVMPGGQQLACYPKNDYLVCIPKEERK